MGLLSSAELKRLEKKYTNGVSSADIVEVFKGRGERFSEATLRKYVQLELLPKSRRVGEPGRHRGSAGVYPVASLRLINEIKRALEAGASLEEIRLGALGLGGEVDGLRRAAESVLARFRESLERSVDKARRPKVSKDLEQVSRKLSASLKDLAKVADGIGQSTRGTVLSN